MNIHYLNIVKFDIIEIKNWYKKQKPGLEKGFAHEVKKCILHIQQNSLAYEIKYRNVRTAFTSIFPYAVHFYINQNEQQIVIIAIVHQSRDPLLSYNRKANE